MIISAEKHNARFTCVSEHSGYGDALNNTLSEMIKISVHYPPSSLTLTGDKHRNKTENKLKCQAEGNPKPSYLFRVGDLEDKESGMER